MKQGDAHRVRKCVRQRKSLLETVMAVGVGIDDSDALPGSFVPDLWEEMVGWWQLRVKKR
jgi:hypothetical protein